jgi:Pyruvate/2-oxoacid:ferredoxin oxidoreductase delta subunit
MQQKSMSKSNYLASVTPETCKACGLCTKRCPMDAVELKFSTRATNKYRKAAVVETDICIGCGVCAHKCKPNSITLIRKEELTPPPETGKDLMIPNVMAVLAGKEKEKQALEKNKNIQPKGG